jgi:hypothetical protein
MKTLKVAALAVAAAATLAACAPEAPLAITGEPLTYPEGISARQEIVDAYLDGKDVKTDLALACYDLAVLHNVYLDDQWLLDCQDVDFVWDANYDTWVLAENAPNFN